MERGKGGGGVGILTGSERAGGVGQWSGQSGRRVVLESANIYSFFLLSLPHTYFYEHVIKSKESVRVGSSACNGGSNTELVRTRSS